MLQIDLNGLISLSWFSENYIFFVLLLIVIVTLGIVFLSPKKQPEEAVDMDLVKETISCFGGYDNIAAVSVEGSRTKIAVKDLQKCELESLKKIGATGIFVTGNQIKLVLPFSSDVIVKEFNSRKLED